MFKLLKEPRVDAVVASHKLSAGRPCERRDPYTVFCRSKNSVRRLPVTSNASGYGSRRSSPCEKGGLNTGGEEEPRRGMRRTMRRGTQFDSCVNLVAQAHPATTIVEPIRFRQVVSRVAKLHQPRTIARLCAWAQVVLTSVQAVHRRLI